MKLTVLVDNNTYIDQYYLGEPAVSYYIEDKNNRILFDMGYSDIFLKNAKKMNIDLENLTHIVFSHGHNDHTRGLKFFNEQFPNLKAPIIAHKDCFYQKLLDGEDIGSPYSLSLMKQFFNLNLSNEPIKITDNLTFLGEIPDIFDFEKRYSIGKTKINENFQDDFLLDDTGICYKTEKGLFIIAGCSHSGICNIVEHAKSVCNEQRILGVIGGFHMFSVNKRLEKTIEYLKQQNISMLYPCHCVSFKAKAKMSETLEIGEVGVGMQIEI